jgi:hypothetical protein
MIWIILIYGMVLSSAQAQTEIPRSVMGCGGSPTANGIYRLNGTVSQLAIGKMSVSNGDKHNVGFWYTVQSTFLANRYAALVVVPSTNAVPGEKIKIPLLLQQSKNLNISSAKTFKATLRFNATLLEPTDKSGYTRINDTGWIEIQGSIRDSSGILKEVEFLAKLGNSENTPVDIESFAFIETSLVRIATKGGVFTLDGVCREGDQIRLTKSVKETAMMMFPNPVKTIATIEANLTERGNTRIYLVDLSGKEVQFFYDTDAVPGKLSIAVSMSDVPNGSYFLIMRTPNELFTQRVVVEK